MSPAASTGGRAGNNQEGCHFDISTQNIIIGKLHNMLQEKGLAQVWPFHYCADC